MIIRSKYININICISLMDKKLIYKKITEQKEEK